MIYINKRRFLRCIRSCVLLCVIVALCIFISKHSGLEEQKAVYEFRTYEVEYQTSEANHRVKVPVTKEVVYRYLVN